MDFYTIDFEYKKDEVVIYPDFSHLTNDDIVCKGGKLFAYWDGVCWRQSMKSLIEVIDGDLYSTRKDLSKKNQDVKYTLKLMRKHSSGKRKAFEDYCKLTETSDKVFNSKIIFSDEPFTREDYATTKLKYTPAIGSTEAFDELMDTLYAPKELEKILWFMGALLSNRTSKIQKFLFLYGGKGTGKGTILKIFKMVFEDYYATVSLAKLTGGGSFPTSTIKELPLLVDEDCDISSIVDDTHLLKLTAHEPVTIEKKYQDPYEIVWNGILVAASNQRYKVRNIDSGITRRAVVAEPTSYTVEPKVYFDLMERIRYEVPAIAQKAIDIFNQRGEYYYENYVDVDMVEATDYIFEFVRTYAEQLGDTVTLQQASALYLEYLTELGFDTKGYKRKIRTELQRYYRTFYSQKRIGDVKVSNVFEGFKRELIYPNDELNELVESNQDVNSNTWIHLEKQISIFDREFMTCSAQYANDNGTPKNSWDNILTHLLDIDTRKLHYVRVPENLIVLDFDIRDETGEKSLKLNIEAASKFPKTYVETSKSGGGLHLHYYYDGDVRQLSNQYDEHVEIKVYTGKQALRRMLTVCNDISIAHISTGLPVKGDKMYESISEMVWTEKALRTIVEKNLQKAYHKYTTPSMLYICDAFKKAEENGVKYDLNDMKQMVITFAMGSTNQSDFCLKLANKINYCTLEIDDSILTHVAPPRGKKTHVYEDEELYFFDIEVFPNMWMVVIKKYGDNEPVVYINPTPEQIEYILSLPLVGFNVRGYDNHILYAGLLGKSIYEIFCISQTIVKGKDRKAGRFGPAYELSYADIYEYNSTKQNLKKWEIEMSISKDEFKGYPCFKDYIKAEKPYLTLRHDEFEYNFDEPLAEELWDRCSQYCINDVINTEILFIYTYSDYIARKILSDLSGLPVNATTRIHAGKFMFGDDPNPQDKFIHPDLSELFEGYRFDKFGIPKEEYDDPDLVTSGKSIFMGDDPSEGGYVYSEPGVYENVALLDVASLHPSSAIAMNVFGPYTQKFADIKQARIYIKHKDFDSARKLFDGKLAPYLEDTGRAKELAYALKIVINSIYGYTSAKFPNKFKDPKNIDNVVAKRGALFMIKLKHEVQALGYTVAHIKTDSIKIPNADKFIIDFVMDFGKKYGYDFELEHTYKRMALINKAVYIAQLEDDSWSATGAQFAEPYVLKSLFTHEPLTIDDLFVVREVKDAYIYIGDDFIGRIARVFPAIEGDDLWRVDNKGSHSHVPMTSGWLWKKASECNSISEVNIAYFEKLASDAIDAINLVGPSGRMIDIVKELDADYVEKLVY